MHSTNSCCFTRRHFLAQSGFSLGTLGLAWLLKQDSLFAKPELELRHFNVLPKQPHFQPRARAMISMFMQGGPSQVDLFDPKPELDKRDGQKITGDIKFDDAAHASTKLLASPWKFQEHGQSGIAVSELLPNFAKIVDDVTLIR